MALETYFFSCWADYSSIIYQSLSYTIINRSSKVVFFSYFCMILPWIVIGDFLSHTHILIPYEITGVSVFRKQWAHMAGILAFIHDKNQFIS